MAVLIDTSVLVAAERGKLVLANVLDRTEQYAISVVTAAELLHGVHRATGAQATARSIRVEGLLVDLPVLPIDLLVARTFARLSAQLAASGQPIDSNDLWIGATAITHDFALLALDGDYNKVPGLRRAPVTDIPRPR